MIAVRKRTAASRAQLRDSRGQSLAEFAFILPMMILLVLGVLEFGQLYQTKLTLRHAVREGARFAITGNILTDSLGDPLTRAESIQKTILDNASRLNIDVDGISIDPPDGGGPEEVVTVSVTHRYVVDTPLIEEFFTFGHLDFTATTAMRNEPFFD